MIIIPDIHGRSFWKDAVKGHEDDEIIFLGDYLDPYPFEWTGEAKNHIEENAIYNFKDVIEFKKEHPNNVTLLLGNHDCEYYYSTTLCDCRCDYKNYNEIQDLFRDNKNLFQLAHQKEINGKIYLFTHAGVIKDWMDNWFEKYTEKNIADLLNNSHFLLTQDNFGKIGCQNRDFYFALAECGRYRGGWDAHSSPIWTDVREFVKHSADLDCFQIFGHTLSMEPIIGESFAMLDARRAFILNDDGVITRMDGVPIPINSFEEEEF